MSVNTSSSVIVKQDFIGYEYGDYKIAGYIYLDETTNVDKVVDIQLSATSTQITTVFSKNLSLTSLPTKKWYYFELPVLSINSSNIPDLYTCINFEIKITTNCKVLVDEIQLQEKTSTSNTNLIKNGGFEYGNENEETNYFVPSDWQLSNTNNYVCQSVSSLSDITLFNRKKLCLTPNQYLIQTITQEIQEYGGTFTHYTFSIMGQGNVKGHEIFGAYISFVSFGNYNETFYFKFKPNTDTLQIIAGQIKPSKAFYKIVVGIEYMASNSVIVDNIQLTRGNYVNQTDLDNQGNVSTVSGNNKATHISYNTDNLPVEVANSDGQIAWYEYNADKTISKIRYSNGVSKEYQYNTAKDITLETTKINNEIFTNRYTYDIRGNVIKTIDNLGVEDNYSYDSEGQITSHVDDNSNKYYSNYDKNKRIVAEALLDNQDNMIHEVNTTYDAYSNVLTYGTSNNNYVFTYTYTSDSQKQLVVNHNSVSMGSLNRIYSGSNTIYQYQDPTTTKTKTYDSKDRLIINVKPGVNNINKTYTYDEYNRNIFQKDDSSNKTQSYLYDTNGKLTKYLFNDNYSIAYEYSNDTLISKTYDLAYNYKLKYKTNNLKFEFTKGGYFKRLQNTTLDDYVNEHSNLQGVYGLTLENEVELERVVDEQSQINTYLIDNKVTSLTYDLSTVSQNRVIDNKEEFQRNLTSNKTFYYWVKFDVNENYQSDTLNPNENLQSETIKLISLKGESDTLAFLQLNEDDKLSFYYHSDINTPVFTTTNKIQKGQWNYIAITIRYAGVWPKCLIRLNGVENTEFVLSIQTSAIQKIKLNDMLVSANDNPTLKLKYLIGFMSMGANVYSNSDYNHIYNQGIKYLSQQTDGHILSCVEYYTNDDCSYMTFDNEFSFDSGLKPVVVNSYIRGSYNDMSFFYEYDSETKKYYYKSFDRTSPLLTVEHPLLGYVFPIKTSGIVSFKFKIIEPKNSTKKHTILCITNKNDLVCRICIKHNEYNEKYFEYELDGETDYPNTIPEEDWNQLEIIQSSTYFTIYCNNENICSANGNLSDYLVCIGNDILDTDAALNGYIKDIFYSSTNDEPQSYQFKTESTTDAIGRIKQKEITTPNTTITYEYTYTGELLTQEKLPSGSNIIYQYTSQKYPHNITYKRNLEFGTAEVYSYDEYGRIKTSSLGSKMYLYAYDNYGNITQRTSDDYNYVYEYGISQFPTLLTKVTNTRTRKTIQLQYQGHYPYGPTMIIKDGVSTPLNWLGKELVNYGNYTFGYDEHGRRVTKTGPSGTFNYLYDGSKLIQETRSGSTASYLFNYIYDENDMLIGIKYGINMYFYIRDITGNIIKIVDSGGNDMVRYIYDVWGNILEKNIIVSNVVSENNPFLYKGYYYDVETQLYWVSSRYYSPELCRFISPDSIEYLDPQSINGLNLYAYCGNDPINKYDPTGHSAILIAISIGAVLGGIYGGVSAAANDQNILAGILIGAVVGGLTSWITEVASVPLMLLGTFAVGAGGDVASQIILDGKSLEEVNLVSAALAGVTNAGLALVGRGFSKVDSMNNLKGLDKILYGTMTNSPLLGLGMAINMGISKHAPVYTIEDLYNDILGKHKKLKWRW